MKYLAFISVLTMMFMMLGCSNSKKIEFIFPQNYEGYHVFVESSKADEFDTNNGRTTIVIPEGRVSFVPNFSIFEEWHVMKPRRSGGDSILVDNSNLDSYQTRLYSFGKSGVMLNGEKREGYYIFLGDPPSYESFRKFKARNVLDPGVYP